MRTTITAGLLTISAATLALPVWAQDDANTETVTVTAETVLATVNGTEITLGHVILMRSKLPEQYQTLPTNVLFEGILGQLIEQTVLANAVENDTVTTRLAIENDNRAFRANQALEASLEGAVSDADVQAAYDAKYSAIPEEFEFNASHILLASEEDALAVVEALNGGADFAETAMAKSTGPSGPAGGQLGWFGLGAMVPEFENGVAALEVGAVSVPVQTQFGWHVIKLNDKRVKPAPTLDEVREELFNELQSTVIEGVIEQLTAASTVERSSDGIDPDVILQNDLLLQ